MDRWMKREGFWMGGIMDSDGMGLRMLGSDLPPKTDTRRKRIRVERWTDNKGFFLVAARFGPPFW